MTDLVIGLDIGTSSIKAVAVDAGGTVVELLRTLLADQRLGRSPIRAVGVSGIGPCLLVCDKAGNPPR